MIPLDTALTFFVSSVLLALAPGPDNVFVLLHSALHGRRAGLIVVAGLCSGLLFHTAAVALGLAALLAASSTAFTVLKLAGAAYLLWLAWGAWHAPASLPGESDATQGADALLSPGQTYLRGVVMNVSNPKVAIFFLAFLPQFADPARGQLPLQISILGGIFMVAAFLTFSTIAWFAASFGQKLRRSAPAQRLLNRTASIVLAGLALRLAMAQK